MAISWAGMVSKSRISVKKKIMASFLQVFHSSGLSRNVIGIVRIISNLWSKRDLVGQCAVR
jgi:hypothetical protein